MERQRSHRRLLALTLVYLFVMLPALVAIVIVTRFDRGAHGGFDPATSDPRHPRRPRH
jgi:hypothetical protein